MGPSELDSQGVFTAHLPGEGKERPFQSMQRHGWGHNMVVWETLVVLFFNSFIELEEVGGRRDTPKHQGLECHDKGHGTRRNANARDGHDQTHGISLKGVLGEADR